MEFKTEEKKRQLLQNAAVYGKAEKPAAPAEVSANTMGTLAAVAKSMNYRGEGYSASVLGESQRQGILAKAGAPEERSRAVYYAFYEGLDGLAKKTSLLATPKKVV